LEGNIVALSAASNFASGEASLSKRESHFSAGCEAITKVNKHGWEAAYYPR
jgi:hypothetical protein